MLFRWQGESELGQLDGHVSAARNNANRATTVKFPALKYQQFVVRHRNMNECFHPLG
jgi:hypothetical protein